MPSNAMLKTLLVLVLALFAASPAAAARAYLYNTCFYEVAAPDGKIYLIDNYVPACACVPDPSTKDCTCTTANGPGPNCTKARCFAIDSNFHIHTQGYYLGVTNLNMDKGDTDAYTYWDYDMQPAYAWTYLNNPCGTTQGASSSSMSTSEDASGGSIIGLPNLAFVACASALTSFIVGARF